jgi:hypothetical protein
VYNFKIKAEMCKWSIGQRIFKRSFQRHDHEFDGKKWEARGCESGNNLILCGLSKKLKQK